MSQSNVPPPFQPLQKPDYDLHNNVENELMPLPRTLRPNPYADMPIAQLDIDDGANSFDTTPKSSPLAYRRLVEGDSGELRFGSSLPLLGADYDGANASHMLNGLTGLGIAAGAAANLAVGKFSKLGSAVTENVVDWAKTGAHIPTGAADLLGVGSLFTGEVGAWIGFNNLVYGPTNERNLARKEEMIRQTIDRTPWYIRPEELYDPDYQRVISEEWGDDISKWNFDPPASMGNVASQVVSQSNLEMAHDFDPNLHNRKPGNEYWRADSDYLGQLEARAAYLRKEHFGFEKPISQNIEYHRNMYSEQSWDPDNPLNLYLPEIRERNDRERRQREAQQAAQQSSDGYQSRYMDSSPLSSSNPLKRPGG